MTRERVPDLFVEQLAAGALSPERAAEVRAALESEPGGVERLAAIDRSNHEILAAMPPRVFAASVAARRDAASRPTRAPWFALIPIAAAVVALFAVAPALLGPDPDPREVTRAKGDPILQVHRRGEAEPLSPMEPVRAGDLLQLSYTAAGASYGAIVSVDGRGAITWHLPERADRASKLLPGGGVPLDHAVAMDDAPRFERFVLITGAHDFPLAPVERAIRDWSSGRPEDLALDPSLRATVFTVAKEAR